MSFTMVNLVICVESINNSVSISINQFNLFLTCSSFVSSFSLTVFIKFFLIQKSKPSTNLNRKEGKQEKATID